MVYYSVLCSNWLALCDVLIVHQISFEWHTKRHGAGRCYMDFYLDPDRDITYADIEQELARKESSRGRKAYMTLITESAA